MSEGKDRGTKEEKGRRTQRGQGEKGEDRKGRKYCRANAVRRRQF